MPEMKVIYTWNYGGVEYILRGWNNPTQRYEEIVARGDDIIAYGQINRKSHDGHFWHNAEAVAATQNTYEAKWVMNY